MSEQHPREPLNEWVQRHVDMAKSLVGEVVDRWDGVEMAIRSNDDESEFWFSDAQVPCLQMFLIDLWTRDGAAVRFNVYQNDAEFGLTVERSPEPHGKTSEVVNGYRGRALDELPVGEIRRVVVAISGQGDLSEIELDVAGQFVLLVAGETYETWTDRIEFRRYDESVLVFRSREDYDSIDWIPPEPPRPRHE